jgi:hypothetical protein
MILKLYFEVALQGMVFHFLKANTYQDICGISIGIGLGNPLPPIAGIRRSKDCDWPEQRDTTSRHRRA